MNDDQVIEELCRTLRERDAEITRLTEALAEAKKELERVREDNEIWKQCGGDDNECPLPVYVNLCVKHYSERAKVAAAQSETTG